MADFRSGDFNATFEFFVLSGFSNGPKSLSEIRQRLGWAERLLYLAARNKVQQGHPTLLELLKKPEEDGLLKVEPSFAEQGVEEAYALTDLGAFRLQQEQAGHSSLVSQFVRRR